ncbi:MAG TPA: carbohydrate porin [Opitutaceae bacterium]
MKRCVLLASAAAACALRAQTPSGAPEEWTIHAQTTFIDQMHPPFFSAYSGDNSLDSSEDWAHTVSATLFLGRALWPGAALYYDPEVTEGEGLSNTTGIAGFPNGEGSRASSRTPQYDTARLFIRQVIGLGGVPAKVEDDQNQVAGTQAADRLVFTAGKMSATDVFDNDAYSHDARTQFLNWALVDDGAWDFPADAKGYTSGFTAEWATEARTLRYGIFMEPKFANELPLDSDVGRAHGQVAEWEERYSASGRAGAVRLLGYWNRAHMGSYQEALEEASPPDVTATREYRSKAGAGIEWEQQVAENLGAFARGGFDDGHTETWTYTEIDRTLSAGLSLGGTKWGRPEDTLALAAVANGLSPQHREYLAAGGYGFIVGDGRLSYQPEEIAETYYSWKAAARLTLTLDYQYVQNPGYNRDRGPVNVVGLRAHAEY